MDARFVRSLFTSAVVLAFIPACAVGPDFVPPKAPPVGHYTHGDDPVATAAADRQSQQFKSGAAVMPGWWKMFGSQAVDAIVEQAMSNNPDVQAAQASLLASEDKLRAGYGIFFPQAEVQAAAVRQKYSQLKNGEPIAVSFFNLLTLSASVNYALDVFGGQRRAVEALGADADLEHQQMLATYLTLTSNLLNTAIAQAAYQAEIEATQQIIDLQSEQLRLAKAQADAGTMPYSAVLSLQSQLASYKATLPQLQQRSVEAQDLLATLTGHLPAEWNPPAVAFSEIQLPTVMPLSLPSELVHQRPDILAAEARLHEACANVGVSTAALFPSFSIAGDYGSSSPPSRDIFATNAGFWSVGANLSAPVFQRGTLWYRRKAALAEYQQAQAQYRKVVLASFAQVADLLRALEHDAQTLELQNQASDAARQALGLVQANYEAGLTDYTAVIIADMQYHSSHLADIQARASRLQDSVGLFVALGGGWGNSERADLSGPPH